MELWIMFRYIVWCPCPAHGHYTKGHICCTRKKKKKFWVPNIDFIFKSALIYVTSFILFSLCFLLLQCCSEGSRSSHRDVLCVWRVKTAGRRGEIAALAPCILGPSFGDLPCPSLWLPVRKFHMCYSEGEDIRVWSQSARFNNTRGTICWRSALIIELSQLNSVVTCWECLAAIPGF